MNMETIKFTNPRIPEAKTKAGYLIFSNYLFVTIIFIYNNKNNNQAFHIKLISLFLEHRTD